MALTVALSALLTGFASLLTGGSAAACKDEDREECEIHAARTA